ncbi:hypothetical protein [Streptomyces peucetius]
MAHARRLPLAAGAFYLVERRADRAGRVPLVPLVPVRAGTAAAG